MSASERLHEALGRRLSSDELLIYFSARLDESDTHDKSLLTVVGGGVAMTHKWDGLEDKWQAILGKAGVGIFHYKDFLGKKGDFAGWGPLKSKLFLARVNKVIDNNVAFRVAVGVDSIKHAAVKAKMKGIKGFRGDSDYGLCLRWLLFQICDTLEGATGGRDYSLSVIVEDGPYASGAVDLFHRLRAMQGKQPAKYAHRYGDIAILGKKSPSLQAADAIAGVEADRFDVHTSKHNRLSCRLTERELETWYQGMMKEKERRRAYHAAKKAAAKA